MSDHEPDDLSARDLMARPSPPRTVRIPPLAMAIPWTIEPGDELCIVNESGVQIQAEAGTLAGVRNQRINELAHELDMANNHLDYLARLVDSGDWQGAMQCSRGILGAEVAIGDEGEDESS